MTNSGRRKTNVHIMPAANNRWMIMREGNRAPSKYAQYQYEAIEMGRTLAKQDNTQLVIYNRKGVMRLVFNYNQD